MCCIRTVKAEKCSNTKASACSTICSLVLFVVVFFFFLGGGEGDGVGRVSVFI